jgi:hypothetical protein
LANKKSRGRGTIVPQRGCIACWPVIGPCDIVLAGRRRLGLLLASFVPLQEIAKLVSEISHMVDFVEMSEMS